MSSDPGPYGSFDNIEELEAWCIDFAGLIDLTEKAGPREGEIKAYKHSYHLIQARIAYLRAKKMIE
jgi:hypothetical protein